MIVIGTLALTLNTAYLWGYARHAVYITQTTKLYATLAIVDLMSSLTIVPIHASQAFFPKLAQNCLLDTLRTILSAVLTAASTYIVCFLAYDRYLHVRYPYNPSLTRPKFIGTLTAIFLLATIVPLIRLIPSTLAMRIYTALVLINGTYRS